MASFDDETFFDDAIDTTASDFTETDPPKENPAPATSSAKKTAPKASTKAAPKAAPKTETKAAPDETTKPTTEAEKIKAAKDALF